MTMRFLGRALAASVFTLIPAIVHAGDPTLKGAPFSALIVFSGSLSDTGNYASVNGDFPAPLWKNRTTNGPAAIDLLANAFHLSAEPSLFLIGQQAGTNYAVLHANAYGDTPIDLPAQVQAYLGPHANIADPNALYFIFIGANDIVLAAVEPNEDKAATILNNGIASVEAAFRNLYAAGARTFYAPNNVNLGVAPVTRQYGVSARATEFTVKFNTMWEQKLRQLEQELNVTIFRFDFFRQIEDMLKVSGTIGFTNVTSPCLQMPQGECNLDTFTFIDPLLPTERIHQFLGNGLSEALMQQLGSRACTVAHRCGRKSSAQSYGVVAYPGEAQ
jgi:phospholipase/lecithinase/hemolysin